MLLGELLDSWLSLKGLTPEDVAEEMNVPANALNRFICVGKISDLHLARLNCWMMQDKRGKSPLA